MSIDQAELFGGNRLEGLFGPGARRVRLDTLVRLRWLAIAGQLIAVTTVGLGFGYPMPLVACLGVIMLSFGLNAWLWWRYPRPMRISDQRAALVLGFDLIQLAGLLYLTGGLANPFAVLLLAPVLISATILRLPTTVLLGILVAALITLLSIWQMPLPWAGGVPPFFPLIYRLGVWSALIVAVGFICTYAWRMAHESRNLANALAATELALEREQHLSELDGMAAAAAHELGTPLGTITVVAKELSRDVDPSSALGEDITLIQTQAERCRAILAKLSSLGGNPEPMISTKTLEAILDDLVAPHREFGVPISVSGKGADPAPIMRANPALTYGLGNLIENAADFAESQVTVEGSWDEGNVYIKVQDDGPGFAPDVLTRLGEPYISRRRDGPKMGDLAAEDTDGTGLANGFGGGFGGGLGLGFFIAKTLLERAGAQLEVKNGKDLPGACVTITFARETVDLAPTQKKVDKPDV